MPRSGKTRGSLGVEAENWSLIMPMVGDSEEAPKRTLRAVSGEESSQVFDMFEQVLIR